MTYSVIETSVTGVDKTKYSVTIEGSAAEGYTVTNTEGDTSISVEKVWKNAEGDVLPWPEGAEVVVTLAENGTPGSRSFTLDAENTSHTWEHLPLTNADGAIAYSVI